MWLTIIRLFIDNKVKEIMLKTSYFLENVLYAPVNDENMTGAGSSIESVNIVEDDILGNENSTQQMRDVTLGACNIGSNDNCLADKEWCDNLAGSDGGCTSKDICFSDGSCKIDTGTCLCDGVTSNSCSRDCPLDTGNVTTYYYYTRFIPMKLRGYAYNNIYYNINSRGLIKQQWGSGATFASATTGTNKTRYSLGVGYYIGESMNYYYIGGSTGRTQVLSQIRSVSSSVTIYAPGHSGKTFTGSSVYAMLPNDFSGLTNINKTIAIQGAIKSWFVSNDANATLVTLTANCLTLTASTASTTGLFRYTGVDYSFEFSGVTGIDENYYKQEDEYRLNDFLNEETYPYRGIVNVVRKYPFNSTGHVFPFIKLYTPLRYFTIRRSRPGLTFQTKTYDYLTGSTNPNESPYLNKTTSFTSVIGTDYGTKTDEIMTLKNLRLLVPDLFTSGLYTDYDADICLNKSFSETDDGSFCFHIDKLSSGKTSSYTVSTYYQGMANWRKSTTIPNPDSGQYDGVYESFSNSGATQHSSIASMYIDINNFNEFKFYIRSYGENLNDYVMVSNFIGEVDGGSFTGLTTAHTYSDTTRVKAHTRGLSTPSTDFQSYKEVVFSNIGGGSHRIQVVFRRSATGSGGTNQGFVLIPYQENVRNEDKYVASELIKATDFNNFNGQYPYALTLMLGSEKFDYSASTATYRNVSLIPYSNIQGL